MQDDLKFQNIEKFTQSAQESSAMQRLLQCRALSVENLLTDGIDFVLTARLQCDPQEQRYRQYRHINGGCFLISTKDVIYSGKIQKPKSLEHKGINIEDSVKIEEDVMEDLSELLITLEDHLGDVDDL